MKLEVVVVLGQCSKGKGEKRPFGIRFERTNRVWRADWAFAIKADTARREGYEKGEIRGQFEFDAAYPGCPHCKAPALFLSCCGTVGCWSGSSRTATCPTCGRRCQLGGTVERLSTAGDA